MVTGYEVEMYHNIDRIRRSAERIADALEKLVAITVVESGQVDNTAEEDPSDETH